MLFNSIHFLIFFPIVVALYFSLKQKHRWILLLISSYYFYMSWKPEYIILIIISTCIDYFAGLQIFRSTSQSRRRLFLILSLVSNLGLLFAFKYFNFFSDSTRAVLKAFSIPLQPWTLKVLLPVGISFYTFQTLSYTIDIYRRKIEPERHFGIFAVFVAYFPQLVAGPIERASNLLPQFRVRHRFDYKLATDGIKLMIWGFFKKIVIADRLSLLVDTIYSNPTSYTAPALITATVFFAFQIYCDFSGYSDIAIGAAQVMGIRLMDNFRRPYYARNIVEFWRRWHISLSTWFKDYVFIPLGGSRVPRLRWYANIMVVFVVSGLWHGANWTFVVWGGLHGFYYLMSVMTKGVREKFAAFVGLSRFPRIHALIQLAITFLLVNIGWVFFRAKTLSDAWYILTHLFTGFNIEYRLTYVGLNLVGLTIACSTILFMEFVHLIQEHRSIRQFLSDRPIWVRWPVYQLLIIGIIILGVFGGQQFIYFQF